MTVLAKLAAAPGFRFETEQVAAPIGANLPIWILICTFSWRLAKMALDVCRRGMQGLDVGLGDDGIDEGFDNPAQQAPSPVFYAAARWGESPRCSAMSGSVNNANKR